MLESGIQLTPVQGGWAALGEWVAVHAATREEAERLYREELEWRREIMNRPCPHTQYAHSCHGAHG
jgi:hypothetical protein